MGPRNEEFRTKRQTHSGPLRKRSLGFPRHPSLGCSPRGGLPALVPGTAAWGAPQPHSRAQLPSPRLALGDTSERTGESDPPKAMPGVPPPPHLLALWRRPRLRGAGQQGAGRGGGPSPPAGSWGAGGSRRVAAPSWAGLRVPPPASARPPPRLTSGGRGRRAAAALEKEPAPGAVARGARAQGRGAEPGPRGGGRGDSGGGRARAGERRRAGRGGP